MAKRRGRNEGSISQRADGRWMGRVPLPDRDARGRRQRKTVYGATRKEVADKVNKLLGRAANGELLASGTPTLAKWLNHWYATMAPAAGWKTGTLRVYRFVIDAWLIPAFGSVRVDALQPLMIQSWMNGVVKRGAKSKAKLAESVLRGALDLAMQQRLVTYNAAACVEVARPERPPIAPLSKDESQRLLDVAAGHRLGAAVIASLGLGLRIGEATGIAWADVDLDKRELRVRQQVQYFGKGQLLLEPVKSAASNRTLTLPTVLVDAFKARRVAQLQDRMRAGDKWTHEHDLVFTSRTGRMLAPARVRTAFNATMKAAGLDPTRYHNLRHSHATLLLVDGAQLYDVSKVLGHANIQTTSDIYGHLVPAITANATARIDRLLPARSQA